MGPTTAAQMACTLHGLSGGRVDLNVVTGGDTADLRRFGDWLGHAERYARTDEFLTVLRGAWSGTPTDFSGSHYRVEGATVARAPAAPPRVFFGGASEPAARVSARHADVHVAWAEPPPGVAEQLDLVRAHRALREPTAGPLAFALRVHVITRDTAEQAWAVADRLLRHLDPRDVARAQERFAAHESEGQRRMNRLHTRSLGAAASTATRPLEVSPNMWAGFGLVRPRAGTALVGSHDEVADRLGEYHDLGVSHVILSGQPHLEEAYAVAEGLRPALAARGLLQPDSHLLQPDSHLL
jgi:alkanesulfonate monooxygenase